MTILTNSLLLKIPRLSPFLLDLPIQYGDCDNYVSLPEGRTLLLESTEARGIFMGFQGFKAATMMGYGI